ncbi:hypothetical protein [Clostridium perfringens]|uniref:hypothetical protein n=1 Tax=Clostridium perfringens TaxID=1502 RepID=UPI0039E8A5EC
MIKNNYVYKCLNEYNEIIYIGKLINLQSYITDYFKDETNLEYEIFFNTYKIESIKVNYEISAYSISAYLINKHKPKYNYQKTHYKNIKAPSFYNESHWELVRILHPDILPIEENCSISSKYPHILITLLISIIVLALYTIKEII